MHRNLCPSHEFLRAGTRYRVAKPFTDYDGQLHDAGEEWTFIGCSFVPYDDGMTFYVSFDAQREQAIRLQWRPEAQGYVLDHLKEYITAL